MNAEDILKIAVLLKNSNWACVWWIMQNMALIRINLLSHRILGIFQNIPDNNCLDILRDCFLQWPYKLYGTIITRQTLLIDLFLEECSWCHIKFCYSFVVLCFSVSIDGLCKTHTRIKVFQNSCCFSVRLIV